MKRFLLILALLLTPSAAWAQCNGVFPALSACGNPTGSAAIPTIMPLSSITAAAGTNGQVQYNNSGVLGGYTSVQLGAVVPGIGGTTDASLPPYNADPTGVSSSTTAINSAIAAACPSANGTVYLPPGTYLINGGLNMTNITGGHISGGCRLRGAGNTATVLKTTTSTNAAIDLTGSSSIIIEDLWIQTAATTTFGILLSASNTLPCNVIRMMNVTIAGLFNTAGVYINNCSDGLFDHGAVASNLGSVATADIAITATNPLGAVSSYTTISAVSPAQSGDWSFLDFQIHDLAKAAGTSSVIPLYIQGSFSPVKWFGGIIAGSVQAGGGTVTFDGTGPQLFSAIGTQFYGDNGTQSVAALYCRTSCAGITIHNSSVLYSATFLGITNGQTVSRLSISGNTFSGGTFIAANSGNVTVTGGFVDAASLALNLGAGGTLSHIVVSNPGTITAGTQTAVGSF